MIGQPSYLGAQPAFSGVYATPSPALSSFPVQGSGIGIDVNGDGIVDFRTAGGVGIDVNGDGITDLTAGGIPGSMAMTAMPMPSTAFTSPVIGSVPPMGGSFIDPMSGSAIGSASIMPPVSSFADPYGSQLAPGMPTGFIGSNGGVMGPLPGVGIDVDGDGITDYRVGGGLSQPPSIVSPLVPRRKNDVRPYRDPRTFRL